MPLQWRFKVRSRLANRPEARDSSDIANHPSLKELLGSHDVRIETAMMPHKQTQLFFFGMINLDHLLALLGNIEHGIVTRL